MTETPITELDEGQRRIMWFNYMLAVLVEAQKKRSDPPMQQWVDTADGHELAWVLYERAAMLRAVNRTREGLGRRPLSEDRVRAAEQQASGHSDYSRKWALACAELILERP